jgi:TonB family protein
MFFVLVVLLAQMPLLRAKDPKWFEVSSDHFLLFTDTNEAKGKRLVSDLENRVAAFSQSFGKIPPRQFPIEIFLFSQEQDFVEALPRVRTPPAQSQQSTQVIQRSPFPQRGQIPQPGRIPQPGQIPQGGQIPQRGQIPQAPPTSQGDNQLRKAAYLLRGPDRTFIIAKDKSPDDIANDVGHPLGHLLFERYAMWRPFWLAEGAAEYVRKIGRSADTKPISEDEGFSVADMFTIVPSATYNDDDPPTAFRTESYRLVRFLLDQKPDALREYVTTLRSEAEKPPKIAIDGDSIESDFKTYVETPLKPQPGTPAVQSSDADLAKLAIHHGDLLLATDRDAEATRYYNADSKDARAARAIVTRFSRPPAEAIRALDRAARELPDNGLVSYHFGVMEVQDKKDLQSQQAALERAVQLIPLMGRAYAELARVYTLNGQAEKALPLVAKAIELEPEYADHFYETRAYVYLALGQSANALRDINMASNLPHPDRSAIEHYNLKISDVRKRIETARREVDARDLQALETELRAEAERREPPPKPAPPPPPVPAGTISYEIMTRGPIEVVDAVYPEYSEALRRAGTTGTISVQVDVGPDGKVKTASITKSQLQDLNNATLGAIKKWSFKPGNRSIVVVLKFALQ